MSFCFIGCKKDPSNAQQLTTNLLDFESIGIGYSSGSNFSTTSVNSTSLINNVSTKKHRGNLFGIDANGNYSQIIYKENGKISDKFTNLISCLSTERYLITRYSDSPSITEIDTTCLQYSDTTYIIDKTTGYMYKIDFPFRFLQSYFGISASDCGDYCIIVRGTSYYKMGVKNNKLVFTEILNTNSLPGGCEIRLADMYGNCLVTTGYGKQYILTNQNTLIESSFKIPSGVVTIDSTYIIKAYNGKIYNNGYVLNNLGEFVLAENIPDLTVLPKEYLVYSEDNVEYYFNKSSFNSSTGVYYQYFNKIVKRTIIDDNTAEIEIINLDFTNIPYDNIYINTPYIYTLDKDSVISKISILTGEKIDIKIDNVLINSIEPLGFGKILFYGTNNKLQTITGIIDNAGNINYNIEEPNFKVFYYSPINTKK